ncbi:MAG: alpha-amylase family glycosyl hydrolase [Rhodospirillales bacterium]|nr:alpha-amylase family glycosyl hydrolase [Rhodospirillales bacterium]
MALVPVRFEYLTGLSEPLFANARLSGSWDAQGRPSTSWSETAMEPFTAEDGCPAFRASAQLDDSQIGQTFRWGVYVDAPGQTRVWAIPTEVAEPASRERWASFTLRGADQLERYHFTTCRRLGANKLFLAGSGRPAVRFAVWAPNARTVELVRGETTGGYIWNDGRGVTATIPMRRGEAGIWTTEVADDPLLADYAGFDHTPYMFRITRDDGSIAYRTDLYSRCQIGGGDVNPEAEGAQWSGRRQDLDGGKSCSVVVDPDLVATQFREDVWPETQWSSTDDFWQGEFDTNRPVPRRLDDLVIYELHVAGLDLGASGGEGTLDDAMELLDYLAELGVNCIELMPMSEFQARLNWGYSTSHYLAVEFSGGGRDQFKHFVRACHRRGIAVLLDVVYNHYTFDAERAEWAYDSASPENNIYYWYEGRAGDYPDPTGGYIDNGSSGWGPRYWEEQVRRLFISSAAALLSEFHFDGFRVDLTTAIHRDAVIHADGRPAANANMFGQKFLREWSRTLHLINPDAFLIAEDHSHWEAVHQPPDEGGLGFDASWYSDFYHHLIGDAQNDPGRARLIKLAGYGDDRELRMSWFAGVLAGSGGEVVYHESHDEAGNSYYMENGQRQYSARTIMVAVNNVLNEQTRGYAEARVHVAAAMALLSPGIPMFFMGEEVGASMPYRFADFATAREDYLELRQGTGARLFRFYADLIRLRLARPALRSRNASVVYVHDANRILALRRFDGGEDLLVIASLNNRAFADGYVVRSAGLSDGRWREIFNSDAPAYGGGGLGNDGALDAVGGALTVRLPANAVVVLQRQT